MASKDEKTEETDHVKNTAEKALEESEKKFRAQYDAIPIPTYTWKRAGNDYVLTDFNPAAMVITNNKIPDFIGTKLSEVYANRSDILEDFNRCLKEKTTMRRDGLFRLRTTGEEKFFTIHYAFVPPDLVMVHTEDITERKQAEEALRKAYDELETRVEERTADLARANEVLKREIAERKMAEPALRESEAKYASLVEQAGDGVVILQDGIIRFANLALAVMHGYSADELVGRSAFDLIAPECRNEVSEINRCRLKGESAPDLYESKALCRDGTIKSIEVSAEVIQYRGKPAVLGIVRDIGDRKKKEEEILRSQKLESVGLLAGGIAHDFNNLLTGILGNISLAKIRQRLELETYELLNSAEKSAIRAKHLTSQLLTFSKGGAPVRQIAAISPLIEDLAGFAVRGSNVRCEFNITEDLWPAKVDEGQIGQVVNNLVRNAQQAMPEGGTIKISGENIVVGEEKGIPLDAGKYIRVSVEDHGAGIPKGRLERIFDPYFTTKQEGRGLGLAVCHSIVRKHGGHIEVESKLGQGSIFRIYLPAVEEPISQGPAIFSNTNISKSKGVAGGKILLMDDEEAVRDIGGEILAFFGCTVCLVGDGREAVQQYKKARETGEPFDAVILDLTIPGGLGGKETIKELLEVDPQVRGIVSSGYSNDPIMCRFRDYGFKGMIGKPYDIEEIRETIDRVINEEPVGFGGSS